MAKRYMSFSQMADDDIKRKIADHPQEVTGEEMNQFLGSMTPTSEASKKYGGSFENQVVPILILLARAILKEGAEAFWERAVAPGIDFKGAKMNRCSMDEAKHGFIALANDLAKEMTPLLDPLPGVSSSSLPLLGVTTAFISILATLSGNLYKCNVLKIEDSFDPNAAKPGSYLEPKRKDCLSFGIFITVLTRIQLSLSRKVTDMLRFGIIDMTTKSLDGTYGEGNPHLIEILVDSILLACLDIAYNNSLLDCSAIDAWEGGMPKDILAEDGKKLKRLCSYAIKTFLKDLPDGEREGFE